ncbi:hypothetical protein C2S53_002030 [Perilla frutescens var. hirtella]|uniref:Pectinesterase inhibitor domain-containing protein n=1 Tax=Perilla frutescens var. hirtella TaxID=608512 RepID=A0AAD4IV69_PERFH|nr:hypothetical protein C2S53_002030 [Perilla frutescens var. hirtella]
MTTHNASCSPIRPLWINPTSVYINKSCETTLYPKLCSKTLSKYAEKINSSPKILAMTALAATFNATQLTSKILRNLTRSRALKPGESVALLECVEEVSDAAYELQKSMKELKEARKGPEFYRQMDDVQTWVSAALTDDDTCMDDFTTVGRVRILARGFVLTIARLTSISLTFINNYAAV